MSKNDGLAASHDVTPWFRFLNTPPKISTMAAENDGFPKPESPNFQGLLFRFHVQFQECIRSIY